ncbi:MAG: aconitate hydratase, partial [Devosia sp.]|nr:aconitate hydratase [Devosia sp.]
EERSIYDAAVRYQAEGTPLIVLGGKEYGSGSSRDWAAKGTRLLGVRAVLAESFERIHRSNLVGMGVIPLQFMEGTSWQSLGLDGSETVDIAGVEAIEPRASVPVKITRPNGEVLTIETRCRIDTANELDYFKNGGILHYVLRSLVAA